ncbi:aldehyde dehydrogenase (NADP(+)) [Ahrensia kielensis]|uniref:aldehyde dehydrogenase (NADP(+)) n=1 Tax=Ahrensia kielensis TaxID=76980 RepID=UPI0003625BC7|nr:aldehyde dehydrogenase (NADP(+)) [Ahrensia kielensis]
MNYTPHGKHLIAGNWVSGTETFQSQPASGTAYSFSTGTLEHVHGAVQAAEDAFSSYGWATNEQRASFLEKIAEEIEKRGADITALGASETGLPEARLEGERGRTTGQLKFFAEHIRKGAYLDQRKDEALPDRAPLPRPELQMVQRPIGPVAIFGASNFPLAFSTAGGDTASALAAGCPVIVKGHPAHPGTGELVADAISAAIKSCGVHPGVFSLIQDNGFDVGKTLVEHPLICAVGFTGSLRGGRALFELCAQRPVPIPFFGELGSINPMFILPQAAAARGADIGKGWASSLTMGAGQFCTNPGVAVILDEQADGFISGAKNALESVENQTMLTSAIAHSYQQDAERVAAITGVKALVQNKCADREAGAQLYEVNADVWLEKNDLSEEVFGPLGIVVRAKDNAQIIEIAKSLEGQLTSTLHMDETDLSLAQDLLPILERKAGRLLVNGFPTGVEVADAMVHGGPYPASTNFGATSVGSMSIRRFLRPVCYQNFPVELLPKALSE